MKIFKPIIAIFKLIYRFIDKLIVTPISRLIYRLNELSRNNSGRVEKLLNRPNVLIYVSLFCAILVAILVEANANLFISNEAEVLEDQKVSVVYNEEAYVVEGVPEAVDIILIGRKNDIYLAKQLGSREVKLDLSDYGPGTYKVKLQYNQNIDSVDYKLDPGTINVKISEKVSAQKTIDYDLLNEDKLDSKLSIKSVKLDRDSIYVKGSQEMLNKVAKVRALIDLKAAELTEKGTFTVDSIILVAYASDGSIIPNIEMVPSKISASVIVDSYKTELPVKVITEGELTTGYAISSAVSSVNKVEVYGDEEAIKKLSYIEARINVEGLSSNKNFSVTLNKPSGVRYMTETNTNVEVKLETETSKEFTGVRIEAVNVANGYSAQLAMADDSISVIAKGVTSVLENLESSKIVATVDLSGLGAGTHEVEVKVSTDDVRVSLLPAIKNVKIYISKK